MISSLSPLIADKNDFENFEQMEKGMYGNTFLVTQSDTKSKFVMKELLRDSKSPKENILTHFNDKIASLQYPFFWAPSYISFNNTKPNNLAIFTKYFPYSSLHQIVERQMNEELIPGYDDLQEFLILYRISCFLEKFHLDQNTHGGLKLTNILLDDKFSPIVIDPYLYTISQWRNLNKTINYIISLSPEALQSQSSITQSSDIYSFGIIILQVLTHKINVFSDLTHENNVSSDLTNKLNEIEQYILKGTKPTIPNEVSILRNDEDHSSSLSKILSLCFSSKQEERPSASEIRTVFEQILIDKIGKKEFQQYKNPMITENVPLSPYISDLKKKADKGNLESIYIYGYSLFKGENCVKNVQKGIDYIRVAAKNNFLPAQMFYMDYIKKEKQIIINKPLTLIKDHVSEQKVSSLVHLKDDSFFTEDDFKIETIITGVNENYKKLILIKFESNKFQNKNFILTKDASKRLTQLKNYIDAGVPVILEGPTGTSKTFSTEIVCQYYGYNLIRFNLSSETKPNDLLGKYDGDPDSWSGIVMHIGQFIEAYKEGHPFLLDEINLASPSCLQFIEDALDSKVISIEIPGMPLEEIKMNPNFKLIATQNPNKGFFAHKRQDLGNKFLSRFQIIKFPDFSEEELLKIAEGLADRFNYKGDNKESIIKSIVKFHIEWSKSKDAVDDIQCFTIREIAAAIKALANGESIYDTIITIYGSRYQSEKKKKLEKVFDSYTSIKDSPNYEPTIPIFPSNFHECYQNKSLLNALKSIKFSFANHRHVILVAREGTGVTQVARWVAQWYNNNSEKEYFCICTEETKCSDLIGKQKPSNNELIKWIPGFLTEAVEKGFCCVLDNFDQAPSTVAEKLNGLLDQKFDNDDNKTPTFKIPENPKNPEVNINDKFRLLCTCKVDTFNQMSPALINRFDVIVLENQIENNNEDLKELIQVLMKQAYLIINPPEKQEQKDTNISNTDNDSSSNSDESDDDSSSTSDDSDDKPFKFVKPKNKNDKKDSDKQSEKDNDKTAIKKQPEYEPNEKVIDLIINHVINKKNITMFQLSQLCRAVTKFLDYFDSEITPEEIVDFSIKLLNKNQDFEINPKIEKFLSSKLNESNEQNDSKFFFKEDELAKLRCFLAKLFASSLINLPCCVSGPTGVGKTASAREFARIRPIHASNEAPIKTSEPFQMHSFHFGTKPVNFYGTTTIKDKKIDFINGTLTTAMINGQTFIADEMNLASISTMKSLAPALELYDHQSIYISGVENPICINQNFFFIACQNDLGTIGRNTIPSTIASRFRYFKYPEQEAKEISSICIEIAKNLYGNHDRSFTDEDAGKVGQYMVELNKLNLKVIPQWSLRDITKLFQRIHYQDAKKDSFINIKLHHNLLFYTLSPVSTEYIDEVFDPAFKKIVDIFELDEETSEQLKNCYKAEPQIQGKFLKKGNSKIFFGSFENIDPKLTSLLNGMFQILLSNPTEPILLMGPSGFKTYLAQLFLNDAKIITLNQESVLSQLLGASAFLSKEEAKLFYIDVICKICHIYNREFISKIKEGMIKKEQNDEINISELKEELNNEVEKHSKNLPGSFKRVIEHLKMKLFDEDVNKSDNRILSNLELEFRPGLFLAAILEGKSLILKNLSNLPTIILERFNELFSGKHNLTLNEDIHNTFTDKSNKELIDISSNFRVLATCPPNSVTKLSEAVLSRFSVIWIDSYKPNEQEIVLKSYIKTNKLNFDESSISILTKFAEDMNHYFHKYFSFPQIINSIEMCSRLNEIIDDHFKWKENLGIILYRLGFGLLENRSQLSTEISSIFDIKGESQTSNNKALIENKIISSMNIDPLKIESFKGYTVVKSEITGAYVKLAEPKAISTNLAFTAMFSEMLDVLLLGLSINIPVIFEGMPGQGKQTAINYVAQILGYNVINIIISQSTKVDDLLGKITIERDKSNNLRVFFIKTKLVNALESDKESDKSIVVFHNINNASSAVAEVLSTIFDQHQKYLLLPDGSTISKIQLNIVGIFNPQNGIYNRDKFPSSLIYSSIYHVVKNPSNDDIKSVIKMAFKDTKFSQDHIVFYERFISAKDYAIEVNALPLTLNDIFKYKTFREVTFGKFDNCIDTISLMIFAYRFLHQDYIAEVTKKFGLTDMKFIPAFIFNKNKQSLFIKVTQKSKNGLKLKRSQEVDINIDSIRKKISGLILPQKHCLLFLACSVLSKQSCIIQGGTAAGKSYIVRLFAQMMGKKLNVYQMNSETNASILTGQSTLTNELDKEDVELIKKALKNLDDIEMAKDYITENISDDEKEWKRNKFTELINFLSIVINDLKASEKFELAEKVNLSIQMINDAIQQAKRFKIADSSFINAMIKGEWVLIDGIESAPSEIAEKISHLCGDNPELDLLECGKDHFYTRRNVPGSKHIHDDFHLFITYNPMSLFENKTLDPSFLNNCALFTLPPIDSTPDYSAQMLLGELINLYPKEFAIQVSKRMANVHSYAKNESNNDKDSFAGDLQFTGRTLTFVIKDFMRYANNKESNKFLDLYQPICNSMRYYYWNSYINQAKEAEFQQKMVEVFSDPPKPDQFLNLSYEGQKMKEKNINLLVDLRNIQLFACKELESSNFSFVQFVMKCLLIEIADVQFIHEHILDTIKIISCSDQQLDSEFFQLKIIERVFNDIIKGMDKLKEEDSNLPLKEDHLLKNKDLNKPISKLRLLNELISNNPIFISTIPRVLYDEKFITLMEFVLSFIQEKNVTNFTSFISILYSNPSLIPEIESRIPYALFNNTPFKMICYLMPTIKKLHKKNITFRMIAFGNTFDFDFNDEQSLIKPIFVLRDEKTLTLSSDSYIIFNNNERNNVYFNNLNGNDINIVFYAIIRHLIKNPSEKITDINSFGNNVSNKKVNRTRNFSLLLNDAKDSKSDLISKAWTLIYAFPIDLVQTFSKHLQPLEAETVSSLYNVYNVVDKNSINSIYNFSHSFREKNFGSEGSYLYKLKYNLFVVDKKIGIKQASQNISDIQSEIDYLEVVPDFISKLWDIKSYIDLLDGAKIKMTKLKQSIIQENVDLRLRNELEIIINDLKTKDVRKEYEHFKNKIDSVILDSEQKLTDLKVNVYKILISDFLNCATKSDVDNRNNLLWPSYKHPKGLGTYIPPMIRLYNHIIWFSQINQILDNLANLENANIFNDLLHLSSYNEMQTGVNKIFGHLFRIDKITEKGNDAEKVIKNIYQSCTSYVDIMKSVLNAHFIANLIKDNLVDEIGDFYSIFNDLEKRKPITDEKVLAWIHDNANNHSLQFKLTLPKFNSNDFILLFIDSYDIEKANHGILLNTLTGYYKTHKNTTDLLEKLKDGLKDKKNDITIQNAVLLISVNVYNIFTYQENKTENTLEQIKNKLIDYNRGKRMNQIVKYTIDVLKFVDKITNNQIKFTFNDVEFLKKEWIENEEFVNLYPSLVYWLCKHHRCASQLQSYFGNMDFSQKSCDKIPFWLFTLRLISSESCIGFECSLNTNTAKQIKENIDNIIKEKISSKKLNGTKWINVLLSNVPPEISISNCRMLYQFLLNIAEDDTYLVKELKEYKEQTIKVFINKVFNLIFEDNLDSTFDAKFDSEEQILLFLKDPNKFIYDKFFSDFTKLVKDFPNRKAFSELLKSVDTLKDDAERYANQLSETIKKEIENKEKKTKENIMKQRNDNVIKMKKELPLKIDEYKKEYEMVSKSEINIYWMQSVVARLINLSYELPSCFDDNSEKVQILKIEFNSKYSHDYVIYLRNKFNPPYQPYTLYTGNTYYFYPYQVDEDTIDRIKKWRSNNNIKFSIIELKSFPDTFDFDQYYQDFLDSPLNYNITLIIGQKFTPEDFIKNIGEAVTETTDFVKSIRTELEENKINSGTFEKPHKIKNNIANSLLNNFCSMFSDGDRPYEINKMLQKGKKMFDQLLVHISTVESSLKSHIEAKWKLLHNSNPLPCIFDPKYELPIPRKVSKNIPKDLFNKMANTSYFSTPFLYVENDSIVYYGSLNFSIGPIIPSLYSKRIAMNFISFIEKPFSMNIQTDEKYSSLFTHKPTFLPNDLVQIFISLQNLSTSKEEIHNVHTKITFKSEKLKEKTVTCVFSIKVLPLSFLISCDEYLLSFKDNAFYVCVDQLNSLSKLTFSIQNYYLEDQNFVYQIARLVDNTHPKPEVKLNEKRDKLELQLERINEVKRLHCELKLKFSDQLSTSIIIDCIVIPFDFEFSVYSHETRTYSSYAKICYPPKLFPFSINLHCRIDSCLSNVNCKGIIEDTFPNAVKVSKYKQIDKQFIFNGSCKFDIVLNVTGDVPQKTYYSHGKKYSYDQTFDLNVTIFGIKKTVQVTFVKNEQKVELKNNKINQSHGFIFYGYSKEKATMHSVAPNSDLSQYYYLISPFSCMIINQIFISYDKSDKFEIKNSKNNLFMYISPNGGMHKIQGSIDSRPISSDGFFGKIKSFFNFKTNDTNFYPIYGIADGCWYPVFNHYPDLKWNELEFKKENIKTATTNINQYNNSRCHGELDFILFIQLFINAKIINKINKIINLLPLDIRNSFTPIINNVQKIGLYDKSMIILEHNAILLFYKHFKQRFEQIKENSFYITENILPKSKINYCIQVAYDKYNKVDENAETQYLTSPQYKSVKAIKENIKAIHLTTKPEKELNHAAYLYSGNSDSIPKTKDDKPQYATSSESENKAEPEKASIPIKMPPIYIPNESENSSLSIKKLDDLYLSCIKVARLFPIFVTNLLIDKSPDIESKAIDYFRQLLQLYERLPETDYSLISSTTYLFSQSFVSMIGKLKKANVNFGDLLPSKCVTSDETIQDCLQYPEKDKLFLPSEEWITKEVINKKEEEEDKDDDGHDEEEEENPKTRIIVDDGQSSDNNKTDNKKEEEKEEEEEEKEEDDQGTIVVSSQNIVDTQVSQEQFNKKLSEINETNGIKRGISRMENTSPDSILEFCNGDYQEVDQSFLDTDKKDFPIDKLIKLGSYLVSQFIQAAFEINIPRTKSAVNILVDCSSFISDENKIFNMFIICALTTTLHSLEIPYSVAVVADKNFKRVIKSFKEPHSSKCLQRICECMLIKRYRTKLASSIKFAIDYMKFDDNLSKEQKEDRPYRSIFVFSDGIDEQLILAKEWSEKVLIQNDMTYGLIFIKSQKLTEQNIAYIEKKWALFETEVNKNKVEPILKIASIKNSINDDLVKKLVDLFKIVMKRNVGHEIENKIKSENKYESAKFTIDEPLTNISKFMSFINDDFKDKKEVFIKSTPTFKDLNLQMSKTNLAFYRNKLRKIVSCNYDDKVKNDYDELMKYLIINRREINQASSETIFKPNKDTRTSLSTTGTEIDIIALVLNLLNPVPNPMIYLELKGGLVRNYGVSVVIDPSITCFDNISGPHSFQTIRVILSTLASLDLPCFDLIVAGNPRPTVICSEVSTLHSLSTKSTLFSSLLACLQNPVQNVNLSSAIHTAFELQRMRSTEYTSIFFVLTNGLYQKEERERITSSVNICVQSGITVFGIGIGIYPKEIEDLFPQIVFSPNPLNVMKASASFYGDTMASILDKMKPISFAQPDHKEIQSITKILIDNEKNPIFNALKEQLEYIPATLDAVSDMVNSEKSVRDQNNEFVNPEGGNDELGIYTRGILNSQKILIVMLWDCSLNDKESKFINTKFIKESPNGEKDACILSAVSYYGIDLDIVQNYEDAIKNLTKNVNGYCDYYAVWVFCGPPYPKLPGNGNVNLVGQFIDVLILFWQNGGSIVFWAEGHPLYYQVNLFLEKVRFKREKDCPDEKTKLRLEGEHQGEQILIGDETGLLDKNKTFNRSNLIFERCERTKLSHNIGKIFEGITISYVPFDLEKIKPFKPFSRDSEGGLSSFFYCANLETGTGDIVIDCGYTKCFTEMGKDVTFRYVQNIAGWTGRPEIHIFHDKVEPSIWRPKAFEYTINYDEVWEGYEALATDPKKLRTLWAIDCSGSVSRCVPYHEELKKIVEEYYKENDDIWLWDSGGKHDNINKEKLVDFYTKMWGRGGTDSSLIAEIANKSDCKEHLLIVTDGSVDSGSVDEADRLMKKYNIKFKYVTTFLIGKKDLSVGAPYCRDCENVTYYIDKMTRNKEECASLSKEDLKTLQEIGNINTYEAFTEVYQKLHNAIRAFSLGKQSNSDLMSKLDSLKQRVKGKCKNQQQSSDFEKKFKPLFDMANGSLRNDFSFGAALVS